MVWGKESGSRVMTAFRNEKGFWKQGMKSPGLCVLRQLKAATRLLQNRDKERFLMRKPRKNRWHWLRRGY